MTISFSAAQRSPIIVGLLLPILMLSLYSLSFLPFIADDALISLRYVQNLLAGKGLIWTEGIAVEGYSNLSWVLAVAGLGYWGLDLITASRLLAALLYFSILLMNYLYWRPFLSASNRQFFYLAQYAFAFSATTAVWLVGGLEQPLVAASIAWAVFFLLRDQQLKEKTLVRSSGYLSAIRSAFSWPLVFSSLALGVMCITRPDSPLICLCLALALFVINGVNWPTFCRCAVLAIFPLLFVIGQLWFRLEYYGEWVATPALIKVQPSLSTILIGVLYVLAGLLCLAPFSYYCARALAAGVQSSQRALAIITITTLSIWFVYLCLIGGDIFPAFRHFTLVSVFLSLAFPMLEFYFSSRRREEDVAFSFSAKQVCTMALIYIAIQWFNPGSAFARGHLWVWDGEVIATAMKRGFAEKQPKIAVDAAGALPYWSGYPVLDMLGLNDYHIARTEPSETIKYVGHQFGDGDYVYSEQPDIINFCFPKGFFHPCWKSGQELWQQERFHDNYLPVRLSGSEPYFVEGVQWLYKWSPLVGIKHNEKALEIPGFFFTQRLDENNRGLEKLEISSADQNDIPEFLLRSYVSENNQWQIDIHVGMTVYSPPLVEWLDEAIAVEDYHISYLPESSQLQSQWVKNAVGQWQLKLQSLGGSKQPLQRLILTRP